MPGREGGGHSEGPTQCPVNWTDHITQQTACGKKIHQKVWLTSQGLVSWLTLARGWFGASPGKLLSAQMEQVAGGCYPRRLWEAEMGHEGLE